MARDKDHDSVATLTPLSHSHEADKKHKKKKRKHDEERESSKHSKVKKDHHHHHHYHHHHHHESQSSRHSDGSINHKSKKDRHEEVRREASSDSRSKEHKKRKREKSRESDGREGYVSKTESPHKKERKDYDAVPKAEEENNFEDALDDPALLASDWTYDDELRLVETMKEQVPVNDKKSHRMTLKSFDWEAVSTKLTHSATECEEKWKEIMGFLVLLKPLSMLLAEAEVELSNMKCRRKRVARPYARFLKEFCAKNACKGQGSVLSKGTEAWNTLDPEIKKQYYERYYQELREAGVGDVPVRTSDGPIPALTPFEIFLKTFDGDISSSKKDRRSNARSSWISLPMFEKATYIEESLVDLKRYRRGVEEHKAEHPDWNIPKQRGPSREDIKLYLEFRGLPAVPQSSPAMLMLNDLGETIVDGQETDGKKRMITANQKFKEMPEEQKEEYIIKLEKQWSEYKSQMEEWRRKADKNLLDIADEYVKEKKEPVILRTRKAVKSVKPPKPVKPKTSSRKKEVEKRVESNLLTVKFIGEPPKPPASGYRLFFSRFMKQSTLPVNERMRQAGSYWEKLTEDQKDCYERKVRELKENYCKDVMNYVKNLDEEHRKMYLGTKRRYLKNLFGHDPFLVDYPTSEYPVFVRSPKQKAAKSKVQNQASGAKKEDKSNKKEDSNDSDDSSSDESKGGQDDEEDDDDSSDEESEESEDAKEPETSKSQTQVAARASGLSQLIKHTNNQNSSDSSDSDSSSDESSNSGGDEDDDEEEEEGDDDDDDQEEEDNEEEEEEEEEEDVKESPPPPPVKTPTVPKHSKLSLGREKTFTNSVSKSVSPPKVMNSSAKPTVNAKSSSSEESNDDSSEANSSDEESDESVDEVAPAWHNQSTSATSQVQQSQEDSDSDSSDSY